MNVCQVFRPTKKNKIPIVNDKNKVDKERKKVTTMDGRHSW